jgi:hypothetical protein
VRTGRSRGGALVEKCTERNCGDACGKVKGARLLCAVRLRDVCGGEVAVLFCFPGYHKTKDGYKISGQGAKAPYKIGMWAIWQRSLPIEEACQHAVSFIAL